MGKSVIALIAGLIFGMGLVISGMSNPAKVLNFFDVFGTFDASLLFVMGGGVFVVFIGYRFVLRRTQPILVSSFQIPSRKDIDKNLIIGAALFGIGWGIGGLCPGPALTALLLGSEGIVYFFPAMLLGLALSKKLKA